MRSFQIIFLVLFISFYAVISLGAYLNLRKSISKKFIKSLNRIFVTYTLLFLGTFIFLYIYPNQPREAKNYDVYFYFNVLLFIDFFVKLVLSFFYFLYLFFRKYRNANSVLLSGIIIGVAIGLVVLYGAFLGKNDLSVNHVELYYNNLPQKFDNFKIVQYSDIHLGSFLHSSKLLEKTAKQIEIIQPDLILFTGDLVNNFWEETTEWKEVFNKMNAPCESYSILGNHDYGDYTTWKSKAAKDENFKKIVEAHKEMGFHLLRNEHVPIVYEGDTIYLAGVENWGHPPFPQLANLNKAMKGIPANSFKILMTHDPAHWESQVKGKRNIELTLSGHTHGLQWGIKIAGIPFSLAYFIRKNWGGLYSWNKNYLYVNTGLGTVGVSYRIDMNPELTVITLKRGEVD